MLHAFLSHHYIKLLFSFAACTVFTPKMGSRILIVLFASLLLASSRHQASTTAMAQEVETVHFKLKPALAGLQLHKRNILLKQVEVTKIHKKPSEPNPIGNHYPPSKN